MFTEKAIYHLRVELYNLIRWSSEGLNLFRKIPIFVRAYTIYDAFTMIAHAIFRIAYDM